MTCDCCGADLRYRSITLDARIGKTLTFCSDACELRYLREGFVRARIFLNRIRVLGNDCSREIATIALKTNLPP